MRKPRQPDPEVMESDYRIPAAVGSVAWAIALAVLLALGEDLSPRDRWWIWVCVVGLALGVFAYCYVPRLLRKRAEAEKRHSAGHRQERDDRNDRDRSGEPSGEGR